MWASRSITFYLYPVLQISILIDFFCNLRIVVIFSYSDFWNEDSKKKMSFLNIKDLKVIDLPLYLFHCGSRRAVLIIIISDVNWTFHRNYIFYVRDFFRGKKFFWRKNCKLIIYIIFFINKKIIFLMKLFWKTSKQIQ